MARPRRLVVLQGDRERTGIAADRVVADLDPERVLRVGPQDRPPSQVRRMLGRAFDAVVLDLHERLDADLLGQCHGFVRGGGGLVLRLPAADDLPRDPRLAVAPFTVADVGTRGWQRFLDRLPETSTTPLSPADHHTRASADQDRAVLALVDHLQGPEPRLVALTAPRGRGKSAAVGRALAEAGGPAVVTAADPAAVAEVFRFATGDPTPAGDGPVRFRSLRALLAEPSPDTRVLVVEEAAGVPVPTLQQLVRNHPGATVIMATTTRGYEGTGRGFVLRFLAWADRQDRPLHRLTLAHPIRWPEHCPLEAAVDDLLALDATPAPVTARVGVPAHAILDRDALAADEALLREVFGLLVHAHYRTTPSDLLRLLDAPNLTVHVLRDGAYVVAACLVAREGGLSAEQAAELAAGRARIRGHALADSLVAHCGRPDAGPLRMVRSVRIATHPALRRQGLASRLVDAVHATNADADLFGTLFGATPDLLSFRRSLGYQLVRVGGSRGERTGEPAAVMVRPMSGAARDLVADLAGELSWNLAPQLQLLAAEGELGLSPGLEAALSESVRDGVWGPGPAAAAPPTRAQVDAALSGYLHGPRTYDSVAFAARARWGAGELPGLSAQDRALVVARVREGRAWREVAAAAGLPSVRGAQRGLRRALRTLAAAEASDARVPG